MKSGDGSASGEKPGEKRGEKTREEIGGRNGKKNQELASVCDHARACRCCYNYLEYMRSAVPKENDIVAGRYRVERTLGVGGMAVVLAAHDQMLDNAVAIKLLSPDAPESSTVVERFVVEARAAANVRSPHVARVLDVGTLDTGAPFMVMERLDGCDLEELLALEHTLAIADAADYVLQALHGLANAHALGIVHRDLKPANLFLARLPDGTNVIKVLDFGVAKLTQTGAKGVGAVTMEGVTVGSPMYMSPEQIRSSKNVDERTDVWSVGAVLYELLTGRPPFAGDGVGEIFAAVLETTPTAICTLRPEVPAALDAAVMRCLDRDVEHRFADVGELARALEPFGSGRWASLVPSITQTLVRSGLTAAPPSSKQPARRAAEIADTSPVTSGVDTLDTPKKGRQWLWPLLATAAAAFAVVAMAAVRFTTADVRPVPRVTNAVPSASIRSAPVVLVSTAPVATASASAAPTATARSGSPRSPRAHSSRPAILDSPN